MHHAHLVAMMTTKKSLLALQGPATSVAALRLSEAMMLRLVLLQTPQLLLLVVVAQALLPYLESAAPCTFGPTA